MATKQFFNLNPLLKLDGYYLLSDLLNVPNLRQRAFAYLSNRLKRFAGVIERSVHLEVSRRERAIFVAYGLVAFVFSYWFLARIVLGIGGYLTARYQAMGFGLFTVFLGLVFPQPMRRLFQRRPPADGASPSSAGRRAPWVLGTGALLAAAFVAPMPLRVGGAFDLLPERNADLRATVEGVIEQVYVDEATAWRPGTRSRGWTTTTTGLA